MRIHRFQNLPKAIKPSGLFCLLVLFMLMSGCVSEPTSEAVKPAATDYLAGVMDQFHKNVQVYTDSDAAGNHFVVLARLSNWDNQGQPEKGSQILPAMDLQNNGGQHAGTDCIKACFNPISSEDWGGWYFMNGRLTGSGKDFHPVANWGTISEAGLNLSGADEVTFWTKGKSGGERVEFFAGGISRNADTGDPVQPYPDSSSKIILGIATLSEEWKKYELSLAGRTLNMFSADLVGLPRRKITTTGASHFIWMI